MIKQMKARYKKDTFLSKIAYIKKEWGSGQATQADADLLLSLIQEAEQSIAPYIKDMSEPIRECKRLLSLMDHALEHERLKQSEKTFVVFAGFTPDMLNLNVHLSEHMGIDEGAVVMGHFLINETDEQKAIETAMQLAMDKGVVFLMTQEEKEKLLEKEWDRLTEGFIRRLQPVLDTKLYTFFADEEDMGIKLSDLAEGKVPNLSDKLFVHRVEEELEQGFSLNDQNRIMTLQHGMVTKLEMKAKDEERANL